MKVSTALPKLPHLQKYRNYTPTTKATSNTKESLLNQSHQPIGKLKNLHGITQLTPNRPKTWPHKRPNHNE